jgi:adenylate cyclase
VITYTPSLVYNQDGLPRRCVLDGQTLCRIGRSDRNSVVFKDDSVSRQHAMLERRDANTVLLYDAGSRNGTFVNGRRITAPLTLHHGDVIRIGTFELHYRRSGEEPVDARRSQEMKADSDSTAMMMAFRPITVLVADIHGFTALSAELDPQRVAMMAGWFFREAGAVLEERGAWAQKYIGDAVMAVWLQKDADDSAGVMAALDSLSELARIATRIEPRFALRRPIRIGGGINTGMASIGNLGSGAQADYTAMGEAVNAAFRLESATRELGVDFMLGQWSFDVIAKMRGMTRLFCREVMRLKGYAQPKVVYGAQFCDLPALLAARQVQAQD